MARLIDAVRLAEELSKRVWYEREDEKQAVRIVKEFPTVDAVPVVRCKECKWWHGPIYGNRCSYHSGPTHTEFYDADEFCSRGERKGGDSP